jgi:hypothetical protein
MIGQILALVETRQLGLDVRQSPLEQLEVTALVTSFHLSKQPRPLQQ